MATDNSPELSVIDPDRVVNWRSILLEHLLRLDTEARRLRFFGSVSDAGIHAHVARAQPLALVVHAPDGRVRGCAEVHPGGTPGSAEIAVSVEGPWRNQGVGAALTSAAHREARAAGLTDIRLTCLRQNTPMMHIARSLHARALPLADWALALFRLDTPETP
ncbi:GNAT family N-acetyltransferase [Rhodobaculum claviforme]|uniref:N-acetyltransferase domain-containing protein n=1 Tax=Rhodobaculum claviforme TaxID=1549854 RepID=A0A934WJN6_9RHOB|nr:GNAT family N-acetyltransferase [Rhodobaculum claviforme]MBK5927703.1 hypothetical protein [Rhodobaculum claviforme]